MITTLLSLLLAVPPGLLPGATPTAWQAALLYRDHTIQVAPLAELRPDELPGIDHGWIWSAASPPRRVGPEALRRLVENPGSRPPAVANRPLRAVVFPIAKNPAHSPRRLLAAPAAMWTELPEEVLPSWRILEGGRLTLPRDPALPWRLRLVGQGEGSWWLEVPAGRGEVEVGALPAQDLEVAVRERGGGPLPGAWVAILDTDKSGHDRPQPLAQAVSDGHGRFVVPALPNLELLSLTVTEPSHAPAVVEGRPRQLPPVVELTLGTRLRGRFIDRRGRPVPGVSVRLEGWLPGSSSVLYSKRVASGDDGTWKLAGVPRTRLVLAASRDGFAPLHRDLKPEAETLDLGDLPLTPGISLPVRVVDETGDPVAGARLEGPSGRATSDGEGLALLTDLPPDTDVTIRGEASGFLPAKRTLEPPLPPEGRLELRRAFTVHGRYLDASGQPVNDASVRVEIGSQFHNETLSPDGSFEIDLPPRKRVELALVSQTTRTLRLPIEPGEPGEDRDLGDLTAPDDLRVAGRLVDAADGSPVAGARIWVPSSTPGGPLVALMEGQLTETRSHEDGSFLLTGLAPAPALLRIDAPGHARRSLRIAPEPEERHLDLLDLGEIPLASGATVHVTLASGEAEPETPTQARVDLQGRWSDLDMLTAPLLDGEAEIPHVPPGRAWVSVMAGRSLLCEQEILVPADRYEVQVDCEHSRSRVHGRVLAGNRPAGRGVLLWSLITKGAPAAVIRDRLSPAGARQQRIYGAGRPGVDVPVAADGTFATDELRPGPWRVTWIPAGGGPSEPRQVDVPQGDDTEVVVSFPDTAVRGRVVDAEGRGVEAAQVRELEGHSTTLSRSDGSFELGGVGAGERRFQARGDDGTASEVVTVQISPDQPPEPLLLTLRRSTGDRLQITVTDADGNPAAAALVFVQSDLGEGRILTSDPAGRAATTWLPPHPGRLRAAASFHGAWGFGPWTSWDDAGEGLALAVSVGESGGLTVTATGNLEGTPEITAPGGWDLTALLTQLGDRPRLSAGQPLELQGLPAGNYTVSLGTARGTATVEAGKNRKLELTGLPAGGVPAAGRAGR